MLRSSVMTVLRGGAVTLGIHLPPMRERMTKHYDRAYFDRWYRREGMGDAKRLARKVALAVAMAEYHL